MIDLIKKAMFTGIGFAALTKDKIEEVAKDFAEQGKMSEQEGKKFVEELLNRSRESQEELTKQVEALVQAGLEKMHLAKASDIEKLREEIAELKKQIHDAEMSRSGPAGQ
jgi:polyhydroxyalkanoate synthesis regulator phasin